MTEATMPVKLPLGIGSIIGSSFGMLFKNLIPVFLILVIPVGIQLFTSVFMLGPDFTFGQYSDPSNPFGGVDFMGMNPIAAVYLSVFVQMIFSYFGYAVIMQWAYDRKYDRPARFGYYFSRSLSALFPIWILSIVFMILLTLGLILLVVPGFWIYGVFLVFAPAALIEKTGFSSLGRSKFLTKEYRWQIVLTFILLGICNLLFVLPGMLGAGFVYEAMGVDGVYPALAVYSFFMIFATALAGISLTLIYARLVEIKEGVGAERMGAVFE